MLRRNWHTAAALMLLLLAALQAIASAAADDAQASRGARAARRIIAVGDLHADLEQALRVFKLAGVINEETDWALGAATLVFTGDITDRGADLEALQDLIVKLEGQAKEAGGAVVQLAGNHDVMNLQGDWRYVSARDLEAFGGHENRTLALLPDAPLGSRLRSLKLLHVIGDVVFVHGGLHPSLASLGVEELNAQHAGLAPLLGVGDLTPEQRRDASALYSDSGPVWYRGHILDSEEEACPVLQQSLDALQVRRMVVGHTRQPGRILTRCGARVICIDVGINSKYGGNQGALEIEQDADGVTLSVRAIYPAGREDLPEAAAGTSAVILLTALKALVSLAIAASVGVAVWAMKSASIS
eukprot:tig00001187_g7470.t1